MPTITHARCATTTPIPTPGPTPIQGSQSSAWERCRELPANCNYTDMNTRTATAISDTVAVTVAAASDDTHDIPYSLCIPAVDATVATREQIINLFHSLQIARILNVTFTPNTSYNATQSTTTTSRVFIYIAEWFTSKNGNAALNHLRTQNNFKIMYDFPLFWKVVPKIPTQWPRRRGYSTSTPIVNAASASATADANTWRKSLTCTNKICANNITPNKHNHNLT